MTTRLPKAFSNCSNVNGSGVKPTQLANKRGPTYSTTLSFSTTQNANMVTMACCRQSILKDRKNGNCKASRKLGAIQGDRPWPMIISSPERAILEFLNELPDKQSFEHAADLFSGLVNLSPSRLQNLLESCNSIKVTRLFLWFAERYNHGWMKHLDIAAIDIGSGKRVIAKAGRLDPKYQITVPESLNGH